MTTHTEHKGEAMTDIGRLKELEAKATPGPWSAEDDRIEAQGTLVATIPDAGDFPCADDGEHDAINAECAANAALVCALRNAAPHLLSEIETLRARLAAAERVVEALRNVDDNDLSWLLSILKDGGHDQFWKAVIGELRPALTAYDQGKVTTCDSAPTEGE